MNTVRVELKLPKSLLGALDVSESEVEFRVRQLIALELFREGRISSGKAAELLNISKLDFVGLLGQHGIPYFTETPEELSSGVDNIENTLRRIC